MRHASRTVLGLALAFLITIPLSGCELRQIRLMIPDFDSSLVEGVQVWRLDDATGQPVAVGQLTFSEPYVLQGEEVVDYTQLHADGSEGITVFTRLVRDPANPDTISIELAYDRLEPEGWFKISTFNSLGDSALSQGQTYL